MSNSKLKIRLACAGLVILHFAFCIFNCQAADTNIAATITYTNAAGTTNGQVLAITVNGVGPYTYLWTNLPTVSGFYLAATNSPAKSATNSLNTLRSAFTNRLTVTLSSATAVKLLTALGGSITITNSDGYATITYTTNVFTTGSANVNLAVSNLDAQTINGVPIGSLLSNGITNGYHNPNFDASVTLSNKSVSYTVTGYSFPSYGTFYPTVPPGQCPDPEGTVVPASCDPNNNHGGNGILQGTNGAVLILSDSPCVGAGVHGTVWQGGVALSNYTYLYVLTNITVTGAGLAAVNTAYSNNNSGCYTNTGSPMRNSYYLSSQWFIGSTNLPGMQCYGTTFYYITNIGPCPIGSFTATSVGAIAPNPGPTVTFNATRPPVGFLPDPTTNTVNSLAGSCCDNPYFIIPGNGSVMATNVSAFVYNSNNPAMFNMPTNIQTIVIQCPNNGGGRLGQSQRTGAGQTISVNDQYCGGIRTQ